MCHPQCIVYLWHSPNCVPVCRTQDGAYFVHSFSKVFPDTRVGGCGVMRSILFLYIQVKLPWMWSVSAIRIIQDDMETIILSLRKFSLRLVMIITFAISFLTGFFSLINGESLGITAILSVIGIVFFYITFAVHAIENEQKALRTAYLFVAAYSCK